jgi:hypothetical protein
MEVIQFNSIFNIIGNYSIHFLLIEYKSITKTSLGLI